MILGVHQAFTGAPLTPLPCRFPDFSWPSCCSAYCSAPSVSRPSLPKLSATNSCLTKAEQRAAVDANRAISLGQAIKSLRQYRKHSEVVRARLCRQDEKLVYVLTLLGRSGKVVDATIDAVSGEFHAGP